MCRGSMSSQGIDTAPRYVAPNNNTSQFGKAVEKAMVILLIQAKAM